jgi:peptidoglycan/LPS O-acetylase OafA/YrhL
MSIDIITSRNIKHETSVRLIEIDYLRGFAILAVLAIHVSSAFALSDHLTNLVLINMFIDTFSQHMAVSLFVFISGFVISLRYGRNLSIISFYKRRAYFIFPPYIAFTILYTFLAFNIPLFSRPFQMPDLSTITYNLITANAFYHLWFFKYIIAFYLIYPLLIRINEAIPKEKVFYLVVCSLFIQIIFANVYILLNVLGIESETVFLLLDYLIFINAIFYFQLGIFISRNYELVKTQLNSIGLLKGAFIFMISIILTAVIAVKHINYYFGVSLNIPFYDTLVNPVLSTLLDPVLFLLILTLLLRISILFLKKPLGDCVFSLLGNHSFGIYLVHAGILEILVIGLGYVGITGSHIVYYPMAFIGSLTISYFFVEIFWRITTNVQLFTAWSLKHQARRDTDELQQDQKYFMNTIKLKDDEIAFLRSHLNQLSEKLPTILPPFSSSTRQDPLISRHQSVDSSDEPASGRSEGLR